MIAVVVIVAAGVGTGLLYERNHPTPAAAARVVQVGDNVTVNYIGLFGSGPQLGRVFDTSIYSVVTNNLSYPKSLEFAVRGGASAYTPLAVHVGATTPNGGYSLDGLTFIAPVAGFWQGLVGLPVNKTTTISMPPSLAYGNGNPTCLVTTPLVQTIPLVRSVAPANFSTDYPGANATAGVQFVDPTFGWNDLVLSVNATSVVVEGLPTLGWSVPGKDWPVVVTAVNATTITLTNELQPSQAGLLLGHLTTGTICGQSKFIVSQVNLAEGTYTADFNPEVDGQTLNFVVTVVQFY